MQTYIISTFLGKWERDNIMSLHYAPYKIKVTNYFKQTDHIMWYKFFVKIQMFFKELINDKPS